MSLVALRSRRPSATLDAPDLDVTPVMNLFIILIPFLISMALFTHLAVVRCTLPSNIGSDHGKQNQPPVLKLTIVVSEKSLAFTHGETMIDSMPVSNNDFNREVFMRLLGEIRASIANQQEVIIAVKDKTEFETVIRIMDGCKTAGFDKIGLSNATENPSTGV